MNPAVCAIICTHNARPDYFARCLTALRAQTLPPDRWDLLIVDNRSEPPVEGAVDLSWHPAARVVREDMLGLTPARLRGIRESCADLLVFVDDDNVLDADYLETALRLAEERRFLGAWSGHCRGEFEYPPPQWARRYFGNLCIRNVNQDIWSNLPRLPETMPYGAGLCVRQSVAAYYVKLHEDGRRRMQMDRTGKSLLSGGDNDLAACACALGLGVGVVAALKLTHLMPRERFTVDYHTRLAYGIAYSSVILDAEWGLPTPSRALVGRTIDFLRVMRLRRPHRQILAAAYRGRNAAARALLAKRER